MTERIECCAAQDGAADFDPQSNWPKRGLCSSRRVLLSIRERLRREDLCDLMHLDTDFTEFRMPLALHDLSVGGAGHPVRISISCTGSIAINSDRSV